MQDDKVCKWVDNIVLSAKGQLREFDLAVQLIDLAKDTLDGIAVVGNEFSGTVINDLDGLLDKDGKFNFYGHSLRNWRSGLQAQADKEEEQRDLDRLHQEELTRAGVWPMIKSENGGAICPDCGHNMLNSDGCTKETIILVHEKSGMKMQFNRMIYSSVETERCHDCGCKPGHFHHLGCDMEECPQCGGQLFCCDCWHDEKDGD